MFGLFKRKEKNIFEFEPRIKTNWNQLVYVATEENKMLTSYFESLTQGEWNIDADYGYEIVYLPNLAKILLAKERIEYYAPFLTDEETIHEIGNDFLLRYLRKSSDKKKIKHGLLQFRRINSNDNGLSLTYKFYPLIPDESRFVGEQIRDIIELINEEARKQDERRRKRIERERRKKRNSGGTVYFDCYIKETETEEQKEFDADEHFNYSARNGNISDLLSEVREKIHQLMLLGVPAQVFEELFYPMDKMSKLIVTKDYRLFLPDYNNMEIKMEPLVKAVYLLFLKHPEGIMFKCLPDYRKELTEIYVKLKPYGLSDRVVQSIEDVTNPVLNSINEKCARIRGAFLGQFDNHLAKHYYIDGNRGEAKKIALPRDLVVWE